jgi:hypothetical protein
MNGVRPRWYLPPVGPFVEHRHPSRIDGEYGRVVLTPLQDNLLEHQSTAAFAPDC